MTDHLIRILIIGSGGREHAIGWKIKQDNPNAELFFSKGNAGTAQLGENIKLSTISELLNFAKSEKIDLTIVGPEAELVDGIVDQFQEEGLRIFGPNKAAAELEGSKAFSKEFMTKYGVKTAGYNTFRHFVDAQEYIRKNTEYPIVIKASGLAAGKGVIIANDAFDAEKAVREMMLDKSFGEAGTEVVIEQYLQGFEVSVLSFYNGKEITSMLSAKDHKKIGEGETGLNTGGMGVIAPNPQFSKPIESKFINEILKPTMKGLQAEGLNFSGVIFFGLMVQDDEVYLLEYNVRFGDPETQAVLPLLKSNLLTLIEDAVDQKPLHFEWEDAHSCCVVMASGGYPLNYDKGFIIDGLNEVEVPVFMAGVTAANDEFLTSGGRVLSLVGKASTAQEAKEQVYKELKNVRFDYAYYREDIGVVK